jgi:signal transduction histidine kinase
MKGALLPQLKLDRFQIGRFRSSFLPALLVIALGVTGVVTVRGYRASQRYRAMTESVLSTYVSFVADNAKNVTEMALFSCGEYWMHPVMRSADPSIAAIRSNVQDCGDRDGGRFDLDLTQGSVAQTSVADKQMLAWLLDTIPANPELNRIPGWELGTLVTNIEGRNELVSYAVQKRGGKDVRAIGFIALGSLQHILAEARKMVELPVNIDSTKVTADYFHIGSNADAKQERASETPGLLVHRQPLSDGFGGLTLNVALLPKGMEWLAPGGLPPNRGLEFLALFALASALVASSLLLLKREEQLARTRANFVSGVSHELRTPLAQIRMFAEMLLLGRVRSESDKRRSLEIIDTEARRLSHLVENVLQIARSENGHLHVNPTNMRIAPIIRECVESFSILGQARTIDFRMELQEDLVAPVDSAALRQIVLNLLDNAAKYGPVGQRVVAGVALFDNAARIWVDDEGAGVPVRERERVFDPFYRIRDAQHATGSGIGLAVVRELVALHGGEVWIEDAPDAGARVVVQFPGAYLTSEESTGDIAVA